jgi:hypothetical protein
MQAMSPEPISTAYLKNPSDKSVCLYVSFISLLRKGSVKYIPFIARQRLGEYIPAAKNARNNQNCWTRVFVYSPTVASQELRKVVPAPTKNVWRRRFICGQRRTEGK